MPARSRRTDHCYECQMFRPICVCERVARTRAALASLQTRVVVLMHVREVTLPTNTARLATRALPGSELRLRGAVGQPMSDEGMHHPERTSVLLYPSDTALELTAETVARLTDDGSRPLSLIVPDGSWRQARKVAGREPSLRGIAQVKLPPGPPSRYRLRKEPNEQSVSTFEAIARALGVIEGVETQRLLEDLFETRVERTLWARGVLKAEQTQFGIPQAAFDAFHAAGCRGSAPRAE